MSKVKQTTERRDTQLTIMHNFNVERIIMGEPQKKTIPNSSLGYIKLPISVVNTDETVGDFIALTPRLFSFGVQENFDFAKPTQLNGYSLPLCMWSRDGPTEEEREWTDKFTEICNYIKKYIVEHKEELEKYDLDENDLKKFNPLYWKREKGKIVEGTGPTLYPKLICYPPKKKKGEVLSEQELNKKEIHTRFYDMKGEKVEPITLLTKQCYATSAIKLESVYVGSKITLQFKVYESSVEVREGGSKQLLKPRIEGRLLTGTSTNMNDMPDVSHDASDDKVETGSIGDHEEKKTNVEPTEEKKTATKKVVKKIVRKSN